MLLKLGGSGRHGAHNADDLRLEGLGQLVQHGALAFLRARVDCRLLALQPLALDERIAEMLCGIPDGADLVARAARLELDVVIAGGHLLQDARDPTQRPAEEERPDPCAETNGERQTDDRSAHDEVHHAVLEILHVGADARQLAEDGLDLAVEQILKFLAVAPVALVVALLTGSGGRNVDAEPRGLEAEGPELGGALGQFVKGGEPVRRDDRTPLRDGLVHLVEILADALGELHRRVARLRHVDAARFHDDRRDEAVEMLGVEGALGGLVEQAGLLVVLPQRIDGHRRDHDRYRPHDGDDRINLAGDLHARRFPCRKNVLAIKLT
mgnify:CR=1 FL=1